MSLVAHLNSFGYLDYKMYSFDHPGLFISSRGIDYTIKYYQSRSLVSQSKNEVRAESTVKKCEVFIGLKCSKDAEAVA